MIDSVSNMGSRYAQRSFAEVPRVGLQRSKFDRSHSVKDTMDFDYLTPILVDEVLPGDSINLNLKSFCRLATQVAPLIDNMYVDYFFFFVPNRLVWNNWQKFCGEQVDPGDSIDYTIPQVVAPSGGWLAGSMGDKFGLPINEDNLSVSALPFRSMNLIYNEWFRDQNLQDSLTVAKDDGPDPAADYGSYKRCKKHDYFTSCLPWPQKGDASVLPMNDGVAVLTDGTQPNMIGTTGTEQGLVWSSSTASRIHPSNPLTPDPTTVAFGSNTGLMVDGSDLAGTINEFREALAIQSLLENDARGGTRYVEILKAHFNVTSPDYRLQRSEFLSGGSVTIHQHVVPQTSATSGTDYQASLAAFSTGAQYGDGIGFSKSFTEHGHIIGIACARAPLTYQEGVNRMWSRSTRYDFFWPELQQIGEQAVLNKEIYYGNDANDDLVFGYQERYAEYKYKPSEVRGQLKSTYSSSLDNWHLAEEFATVPSLDTSFIKCTTPIDRVTATAVGYPHLLCDYWFDYKHARPMMTYGVPATLTRF